MKPFPELPRIDILTSIVLDVSWAESRAVQSAVNHYPRIQQAFSFQTL